MSHDNLVKMPEDELVSSLQRIANLPGGNDALSSWTYPDKKRNRVIHQLVAYKKRKAITELVPSVLDVNVQRPSDLLTPLLLSVWRDKMLNDVSSLLLLSAPTLRSRTRTARTAKH